MSVKIDKTKSLYDQDRDTIGKIYRDLQMNGDKTPIVIGDLSNEIMKGLVEDINDGLATDKFKGKPFYMMVHEKKDLQMNKALLRRILFFDYRPWPEDDTTVFWKNPKTHEVRFCWSLPHWSEMLNISVNREYFDPDLVAQVDAYRNFEMEKFGFYNHPKLKWIPNPKYKDKTVKTM